MVWYTHILRTAHDCSGTLQSYTGLSNGEVGVTDLIQKRVKLEVDLLLPVQRICSLEIDGMCLKKSKIYNKTINKMIGEVDMGEVQMEGVNDVPNTLATDLLAFAIEGKQLIKSSYC